MQKNIYYPGSCTQVPDNATRHLRDFKKIGKNIFVVVDPTIVGLDSIRDAVSRDDKMSAKDLLTMMEKSYLRATPAQVAEYEKSKKLYKELEEAFQIKRTFNKVRVAEKLIAKLEKDLSDAKINHERLITKLALLNADMSYLEPKVAKEKKVRITTDRKENIQWA